MSTHHAYPVIHAPHRGRSRGYWAECLCGWASHIVPTLAEAEALAEQHAAQVGGEPA